MHLGSLQILKINKGKSEKKIFNSINFFLRKNKFQYFNIKRKKKNFIQDYDANERIYEYKIINRQRIIINKQE